MASSFKPISTMDLNECRLCFKSGFKYISLFDGTQNSLFVVSVISEHISETKQDDLLPNYVCHDCWKEADTFHTFHRSVQSAQSNYLIQFVKYEFNENEINTEEVNVGESTQLPSFIEVSNLEDESAESETSELEVDVFDDTMSVCNEEADVNVNGGDDVNENIESHSTDANFNCVCDICGIDQGTLDTAIEHYKYQHDKQGYIKCCKRKFFNKSSINEHIEWHKNPDMYKCESCGAQLRTRTSYNTHKSRHNTQLTCDICNYTCKEKFYMMCHMKNRHMNRDKPKYYECAECLLRFSSSAELKDHKQNCLGREVINVAKEQQSNLKSVIPILDAPVVEQIVSQHFDMSCHMCADRTNFDSLTQIQYHYFNEHQVSDGYIKCCSMKFKRYDDIVDHVPFHVNEEIFKCKACNKQLKKLSMLRKHLDVHLRKQRQHQCTQCKSIFKTKSRLLLHTHRYHGKKLESGKVSKPIITDDNRPDLNEYFDMTCSHSECKYVKFTSFQHAKMHYLQVHDNPDGFIQCCGITCKTTKQVDEHLLYHTNPENFKCKYCGKTFATIRALSSHISKHLSKQLGMHVCKICDKVFASNWYLRTHTKLHENKSTEDTQFECSFCNQTFQTEAILKSHKQRIHSEKPKEIKDDKKEICEFCAKKYRTEKELLSHIQRVHSTDPAHRVPKFQCDICNAVLSNKYSFQTHVNNHTSEPRKCPHCGKLSPNQRALSQHIKKNHIQKPIHKCHLCDKSFKVITSLKSHIGTHTGEKMFKCSFCPESFIWRPNMYSHQKKMHPIEYASKKKSNHL